MDDRKKEINELARKAQSGDRQSLQELNGLVRKWALARARYHPPLSGDVENFCSDVQFAVQRGLPNLDCIKDVEAWVKKICKHKKIDYIRRQNRRLPDHLLGQDSNIDIPDSSPQSLIGPFDCLQENERKETVAKALDCLGDRERKVIVLHFYQDKTFKEISIILGITLDDAKYSFKKAKKKLKPRLRRFSRQ